MTRQQTICNACGHEVKPDGYSVSITVGGADVAVDIKRGIDSSWENHYCGRNCLMLSLNEFVDKIQAVPVEGAVVREHEHAPEERKLACVA